MSRMAEISLIRSPRSDEVELSELGKQGELVELGESGELVEPSVPSEPGE
ncbi:AMMECR1 domain-containing protein [Paenibacillus sp. PastH-3]|nr:AMMECR1 domain-containing protein [Paenibacillus sp. PastH-4]MDH6446257.1 AMMECR1 domain-containing protein [Paenibacillus sp. PastF-4]MDH6530275.1 AMMECR1 domain-containing protein [Paenibacillus sp. PastH-3]